MVSRTLEERLTKAKKAVRDTRWWVVVFKYCIEVVVLLLVHSLISSIDMLLYLNSEPESKRFCVECVCHLLWSMLLNVFIRWLF